MSSKDVKQQMETRRIQLFLGEIWELNLCGMMMGNNGLRKGGRCTSSILDV